MKPMERNPKIRQADLPSLKIIRYPDPRLREVSTPVEEIDDHVRRLADRMFALMLAAKGVGLAAPQVGVTVRLFVTSPTFQEQDRRVYVNPELISLDGQQEDEEGCLSFPGITSKIKRGHVATIRATNLDGQTFQETGEGLTARVFQHEMDHINGRLLIDRMGSVARLSHRRALADLEEQFAAAKPAR